MNLQTLENLAGKAFQFNAPRLARVKRSGLISAGVPAPFCENPPLQEQRVSGGLENFWAMLTTVFRGGVPGVFL